MRFSFSITWLAFAVWTAAGQDVPTDAAKAVEMVKKLSSRDFAERAAADKELLRLGPVALPALRDGLKAKDAETQSRCKSIIGRIDDVEWKRKVDAYVADVDGKKKHDLPLLKTYEKMAGNSPSARKLFTECLRSNRTLLEAAAGERKPALKAYRNRCGELESPKKDGAAKTPAGDLAALFFVAIVLKDDDAEWEEKSAADLFGNAGLAEATKDKDIGESFRRLLVSWAESQSKDSFGTRQYFLYFAYHAEFKDGLPVIWTWIRDKHHPKGHFLPMAIHVYAKVGGKAVATDLEKLWGDQTVCFADLVDADNPKGNGHLGDHALAASIRLAGKSPKDYGMIELMIGLRAPGDEVVASWDFPACRFPTQGARDAALKKWRAEIAKEK